MDVMISRLEQDDRLVLRVAGRLDAENAGELARAVEEEIRRGRHALVLDLDEVGFLSSAGIRVLFEIHRAAQAVGGRCPIRTASEPVRKVLELTRLAPILMEKPDAAAAPPKGDPVASTSAVRPGTPAPRDVTAGPILFVGLEPPGPAPLPATLLGSAADVLAGGRLSPIRRPIGRETFALGLATLADDQAFATSVGETVAACGTVFHRRPQPFAVVDYLVGTGDLVPEVDVAAGLVWKGLPGGRAGFESVTDEAVPFDDLVTRLFDNTAAEALAVVVAGEVHGLVGAELVRPLAELAAADRPLSGSRDVAARWLSFSREPVHARKTAVIVGVATRGRQAGSLGSFVRPLGPGAVHGHFHAAVFPHRPLRRGAADLAATIDALAASTPLAVMHLLADPQPVLGSGRSELVRGSCWFAPLAVEAAS